MISGISNTGMVSSLKYETTPRPTVSASELAQARQSADAAEAKARKLRSEAVQAQRDADSQRTKASSLEDQSSKDLQNRVTSTSLRGVNGYTNSVGTGRVLNVTA